MFSFSNFWGIFWESLDMMFKRTTNEKITYIKTKGKFVYFIHSTHFQIFIFEPRIQRSSLAKKDTLHI